MSPYAMDASDEKQSQDYTKGLRELINFDKSEKPPQSFTYENFISNDQRINEIAEQQGIRLKYSENFATEPIKRLEKISGTNIQFYEKDGELTEHGSVSPSKPNAISFN